MQREGSGGGAGNEAIGAPAMLSPSYRGKVRDVYDLGEKMLLVSSDRLSAFDVVFEDTIPGKGKILNQISAHWFSLLKDLPHHFISADYQEFPPPFNRPEFAGRSALVRRTQRIDYECVVRAFLMGSAYKEYQAQGTLASIALPAGLKKGEMLPEPAFTPAVKNDHGHDENISFAEMQRRIPQLADSLKARSLALFNFAFGALKQKGIYLLDTKFEFGLLDGELLLIDEIFTPDSSRFVEIAEYDTAMAAGAEIPTMDKQVIRDYVESIGWNKTPPAPRLPAEVIDKTLKRYQKIRDIILSISAAEAAG
ncbi:MAG: phosphoribosylaminoimidazolesuccinocarboxamide synthase [Turneriella sp.]